MYTVNQYTIENILNWVKTGEIAIPEIQRPFVWDTVKVRDLMDSLYNGYPIGYVISWKNPSTKLKDGSLSEGKRILIDGQQRVTALRAAILGEKIIDSEYSEKRIKISFNPQTEKFETHTPAIEKDVSWISDISECLGGKSGMFETASSYCEKNPEVPKKLVENNIEKLVKIKSRQIGMIELEANLDIETVTEIFVRINSKGVVLSQADFVMSKIASYDAKDSFGSTLRKAIDYFSHLSKNPSSFKDILTNDLEFTKSQYFNQISWLKNENDNLFDPDYNDILRVVLGVEFERGKMSDLVSLLSGRNFESRTYEKDLMDENFQKLSKGISNFMNETNFKRFLMIINSGGFISKSMISSQTSLNMAYAVYLKLKQMNVYSGDIEIYVQRFLVMSLLTSRYSASSETLMEADIKSISQRGIEKTLKDIEESSLSDNFWNVTLIQELNRSTTNSAPLQVFFASQVKNNTKGFLSQDITVRSLIEKRGDLHHIFPKSILKKTNNNKSFYNQIANYVYAQQEINIKISDKEPKQYFTELLEQVQGGKMVYGNISNKENLYNNLNEHAIPQEIFEMNTSDYEDFLEKRKKLIALKIRQYYKILGNNTI
jgi:hypothetical protein